MNSDLQALASRTEQTPARSNPSSLDRLVSFLFRPVDIAALAYFRIAFGLIMAWEAWLLIAGGSVGRYFVGREIYFTYWPFDFIRPWPPPGMTVHYALMGLAGLLVAVGLYYRASCAILFFLVTYGFLIDKSNYLNHIYLVCLISLLMIFLPANRKWSVDVMRKPDLEAEHSPAWNLWLLRFQIGLPYFFGGIAKLNSDWLQGEPLRSWLAMRTDFPVIGQFFTSELLVQGMTYGSIIIDLFVVFALLWWRTRLLAYAAAFVFHMLNARLFHIGIFPWLMITATAIFFPPDWPRRLVEDQETWPPRVWRAAVGFGIGAMLSALLPRATSGIQMVAGGVGGGLIGYFIGSRGGSWGQSPAEPHVQVFPEEASHNPQLLGAWTSASSGRRFTVMLLAAWALVHLLLPLRHFVIPGNVHWTEEGHRFSWHMLLRDKRGTVDYVVRDPTNGNTWIVDPEDHLSRRQYAKMRPKPDMIQQFAVHISRELEKEGLKGVEVRARTSITLNGRPTQHLIDPEVDLTKAVRPHWGHWDWIVPLASPLTPGEPVNPRGLTDTYVE